MFSGAARNVCVVRISGASEIKDPEWRFGVCSALHTINFRVKVAWDDEEPCAKTDSYPVGRSGDVEDMDTTVMAVVPGNGAVQGRTLKFRAYDNVGWQDVARGDPLIGEAELSLSPDVFGVEQELELVRDDEDHGVLYVTVTCEARPPRDMILCKSACLPDFTPGCRGVREEVMCHWGLAVKPKGASDDVRTVEVNCLEFPNPGPITVHGPRGIIDTDVPEQDREDWKPRMREARMEYDLVTPEGKKEIESAESAGVDIPDDKFMTLFPGRQVKQFDDKILVGETYFNDDEIDEYVKEYLVRYPEYQALDNSCQIFVKRLHRFLSSGKGLEEMSDNEYLEGWKFFLELGNDR